MKYSSKIIGVFLLAAFALASLACQKQPAEPGSTPTASTVKAQSPTEAYKMLYAAVKAKNAVQIKQLMSKDSLGFAEFNASQQKKTVDKVLENGFLNPTLAPSITEIRDERIKDTFGRIEVRNEQENRWEDLPFIFEDGGWKIAIGDLFRGTFDPSNALPMKSSDFPAASDTKPTTNNPAVPDGIKSVEVPKQDKPKR